MKERHILRCCKAIATIITGLNPPIIGTTPQQATLVSWFLPLAAYILIGVLVIVPILVLRRRPTKAKVMNEQKHG